MTIKDPPPRDLNADEYAFLTNYGSAALREQDPGVRAVARVAAVAAARWYHDRGVSWAEIARALGISPGALRDWRGSGEAASKRALRSGTGGSATLSRTRAWPAHGTSRPALVLVALGSPGPDQNDFAGEAAAIRRLLQPQEIEVIERCAIELGELNQELDKLRPAVLHLAAHFDFGLVRLSAGQASVAAITTTDLTRTIRAARALPELVGLTGCDTEAVCEALTDPSQPGGPILAAAGWRGRLNDPQARLFTERFYAGLATGASVGTAFEAPMITVTTRWPEQAEPYLAGNPLAVPFPSSSAKATFSQ